MSYYVRLFYLIFLFSSVPLFSLIFSSLGLKVCRRVFWHFEIMSKRSRKQPQVLLNRSLYGFAEAFFRHWDRLRSSDWAEISSAENSAYTKSCFKMQRIAALQILRFQHQNQPPRVKPFFAPGLCHTGYAHLRWVEAEQTFSQLVCISLPPAVRLKEGIGKQQINVFLYDFNISQCWENPKNEMQPTHVQRPWMIRFPVRFRQRMEPIALPLA